MEDNVRITLKGQQNIHAEDERIEMQLTGKWYTKNNKEYILYNDTHIVENSETRTRITIDDTLVSILRTGGTNTHLIFEKGVTHLIPYETPFGIINMVSSTKDIQCNRSSDSLELTVSYSLDVDNHDMGSSSLYLYATKL